MSTQHLEQEIKDLIKEDNEVNPIKEKVINLMLQNDKEEATEELVKNIKQRNKLYTTRDDDKSEIWIYKDGIYEPQGKTHIKEYSRGILGKGYKPYLASQIIAKIEADTYIDQEEFFNNILKDEICVNNGILNLKTRKLTPWDSNKIFFTKSPVEYDPIAVCPNIEKHFKTVLKDASDSETMFELFGFALYKDYFIEKAIMFNGGGRNGKGKTLLLLKNFLGHGNYSSIPLQQFDTDVYSAEELLNKMANIAGDLSSKSLNQTGMFKMLTGRDNISASRKFKSRVNFVNFAKLIFACNDLPKTKDTSLAFWNRWITFDFPYTFLGEDEINELKDSERANVKLRDPAIIDKISSPEELSGLLNKALDGLQRLFTHKDFSKTKGIQDIKDFWIRRSDSFLAFCLDCVEIDDDTKIEKKVLRNAYFDYCKKYKVKKKENDKTMKETLYNEYAVYEDRQDDRHFWSGVKLKETKGYETIEDLTGKYSQKKNGDVTNE